MSREILYTQGMRDLCGRANAVAAFPDQRATPAPLPSPELPFQVTPLTGQSRACDWPARFVRWLVWGEALVRLSSPPLPSTALCPTLRHSPQHAETVGARALCGFQAMMCSHPWYTTYSTTAPCPPYHPSLQNLRESPFLSGLTAPKTLFSHIEQTTSPLPTDADSGPAGSSSSLSV